MRKHIAILLSLLLILSLIGCSTPQADAQRDIYDLPNNTQSSTVENSVSETTAENSNSTTVSEDTITKDEAIDIALKKANLTKDDVIGLHCKLDYDDIVLKYEVEFSDGKYDYDCEINAKSGKVLHFEKELDD